MNTTAQRSEITTGIGKISVHIKKNTSGKIPIVFLHGIYFDHHLWDKQFDEINDRTVISIDMPFHGDSRENIRPDWTLNDCAEMLIEILDILQIPRVIAIGHSWGSMSILRAAHKHPERFESIGLCNMLFQAAKNAKGRLWFSTFNVSVQKFLYKPICQGFVWQNITKRKLFIGRSA